MQVRPVGEQGLGQLVHQREQGGHPAVFDQRHGLALHQVHRLAPVAGIECVGDGLAVQLVIGEPGRRGAMQADDLLAVIAFQPLAQVSGEQVVVAKPFAVVVEWPQEQVEPFEVFEDRLPAGPATDGGGEPTAQALADRGGQQEIEKIRRQRVEDVLGQVVTDGVVTPGEVADQRRRVRAVAQRQGGQLQCGHPSLGAGPQRVHVVTVEVQTRSARAGRRPTRPVETELQWHRFRRPACRL